MPGSEIDGESILLATTTATGGTMNLSVTELKEPGEECGEEEEEDDDGVRQPPVTAPLCDSECGGSTIFIPEIVVPLFSGG